MRENEGIGIGRERTGRNEVHSSPSFRSALFHNVSILLLILYFNFPFYDMHEGALSVLVTNAPGNRLVSIVHLDAFFVGAILSRIYFVKSCCKDNNFIVIYSSCFVLGHSASIQVYLSLPELAVSFLWP